MRDVVIVHDEKEPRHLWRIGRIVKLLDSEDGEVRGAEVKLGKSNSIIRRPVNKLYPLVIYSDKNDESVDNVPFTTDLTRPRQKAAEAGEIRRKFNC